MSTCDKLTGTLTLGATMSGGLLVAKGDKGDKGEGYTLTESDKADISALVIDKLPYNIGVDSEGYICLSYKGE